MIAPQLKEAAHLDERFLLLSWFGAEPIPIYLNGTKKMEKEKENNPCREILILQGLFSGASKRDSLMGEEKPDEELMGKRKSSPRLSTTFIDVDIFRMPGRSGIIPEFEKK